MKGGPRRLTAIRDGFACWADDHGYASVDAMRGAASLSQCADPEGFERGNYQELLQAARHRRLAWSGH